MNLQDILNYQAVDKELFALEMQIKNSEEAKALYNYTMKKKECTEDLLKGIRDIDDAMVFVERFKDSYMKINNEIDELLEVLESFEERREVDLYEKKIAQYQKELESIEKELNKINRKILENETNCKNAINTILNCNKAIEDSKSKVEAMKNSLRDRVVEIKGRMQSLRKSIPEDILIKYEGIRKANKMPVLVEYDDKSKICKGCGMDVDCNVANKVSNGEFVDCPNCGRLLYKL